MLPVEIFLVSLNTIDKEDESLHNLKIEAMMKKHLVLLDWKQTIISRDTPTFLLHEPNIVYLAIYQTRGFPNDV